MMGFIDTVTGVIYAVVAFGILIFFHELGHFLMAKLVGVRVLTFALGFGTKLLKLSWRGTEYAICAFPLGGYVKMVGEDPDEEIAPEDRSGSFDAQHVSKRILITIAGVTFNLMLAVMIVSILHWGKVSFHTARVNEVLEGYPAAEAGLLPGDLIVSINGDPVHRANELRERIMSNDGARILIGYEREGSVRKVAIHPKADIVKTRYGDEIRQWRIGISFGEIDSETFGLGGAIVQGCLWTWDKSLFTINMVVRLIQGKESMKHLGSPVLIGIEANRAAKWGPASYFYFIAMISIILAIMNLLPIPVLDGGRLLFLIIEGLIRRPVHKRVYGIAMYVGIALLACIMAWALYRDADRIQYWMNEQSERPEVEATQAPAEDPEKP
jgi:regulator of sigma E protease